MLLCVSMWKTNRKRSNSSRKMFAAPLRRYCSYTRRRNVSRDAAGIRVAGAGAGALNGVREKMSPSWFRTDILPFVFSFFLLLLLLKKLERKGKEKGDGKKKLCLFNQSVTQFA